MPPLQLQLQQRILRTSTVLVVVVAVACLSFCFVLPSYMYSCSVKFEVYIATHKHRESLGLAVVILGSTQIALREDQTRYIRTKVPASLWRDPHAHACLPLACHKRNLHLCAACCEDAACLLSRSQLQPVPAFFAFQRVVSICLTQPSSEQTKSELQLKY